MFWVLIIGSVAMIALSPLDSTIERVKQVAPWVGLGLVTTEALFIGGLALMAWSVGVRLGPNPLRWRARMDAILARLNSSPAFWTGLAINTIGAVGTGLVVVLAIAVGLPASAWGLIVLPLGDLTLTAAVRGAVIAGVRQSAEPRSVTQEPDNQEETTDEDPPLHGS